MHNRHRQSSIVNRISRPIGLLVIALAGPLAAVPRAEAQPPIRQSQPQPVVHLTGGGQSAGKIQALAVPGELRWKAVSIDLPRHAGWNEVAAIEWPRAVKRPNPTGDFSFELAAGDVLFGSLVGLDEHEAELEVPRAGRIHVSRSSLRRINRQTADDGLIYLGPNGLVGWKELAAQNNWRSDSGRPTTGQEETLIWCEPGLPALASIEFAISWKIKPDFVFAVGVGENAASSKNAFRFEAWGTDLIVQHELEKEADLFVLQELPWNAPGRSHFQAYLDQEQGQILVFTPAGKKLAELKVGSDRRDVLPGVCLTNQRGDVRLDKLRIAGGTARLLRMCAPMNRESTARTVPWSTVRSVASRPAGTSSRSRLSRASRRSPRTGCRA